MQAHPGGGDEEAGQPPRYRYEYLTDYPRRYGAVQSEPTRNLQLAPLPTEEVRDSIERGEFVLFGDAGNSSEEEVDQLADDSDGEGVRSSTPDPLTLSREPSVDDWPPSPTPALRTIRADRTLLGTASPQRRREVERARPSSPIVQPTAGNSDEDEDDAIESMLMEAP